MPFQHLRKRFIDLLLAQFVNFGISAKAAIDEILSGADQIQTVGIERFVGFPVVSFEGRHLCSRDNQMIILCEADRLNRRSPRWTVSRVDRFREWPTVVTLMMLGIPVALSRTHTDIRMMTNISAADRYCEPLWSFPRTRWSAKGVHHCCM